MKKIIFFLTFIITTNIGKTQSSNLFILNDIINDCLNNCLSETNISTLLIDYYPFSFEFSDSIKSRQLNYVSIKNQRYYKYLKKGQKVLFFDGLSLDSNKLIIQFSGRFVKYEGKKHIVIAISDWFNFIYEYSCDKKQWIFIKKNVGGI
jgi:hypothetical protein